MPEALPRLARRAVLLVATVGLALQGCAPTDATPDGAAREFLRAVRAQKCDRVWELFSVDTRARIETRSREALRNTPYPADYLQPQTMYCRSNVNHVFHTYLPRTAELASSDTDSAVVRVQYRVASSYLIPGFFATSWEWRVALPDLPPAQPAPDPALGDVRVSWTVNADGEFRGFAAEHRIAGTTPQAVQRLLMDESTWRGIVPFLDHAERAGAPDEENQYFGIDRLMRARFGPVPGGAPVERALLFATAGGRAGFHWATTFWYLDGTRPGSRRADEPEMPPLQVELALRSFGTDVHVTLSVYVFDPARVPDGWSDALRDDVAAARLLHTLERRIAASLS
jgi:hypothetical protein